ncbi:predicted membrane-associated [Helicobacter fennelliae MRY12-0050]|uniref:Predicted membrane-associated n=3 Tax=Helicobacter fennelliae TaxID=215 RepID=T1D1G9_9HELI|nr:predicted membrane-associated [Helicobacter fennelliae MRY12-0050]
MNHDSNESNTAGIKIGLPNSSNKGFDVKAGMIDSNPNAPYNPNNNLKLYDSKDTYNRIPFAEVIMCNIDCEEFLKNATTLNKQNNIESTTNTESAHQNNTNQPFTYEDSNITAKEIINKDNTSTLVIESNTNLLEYQGNIADTLMSGLSGVFASMATLAEKYGVDKSLKESTKGLGTKGRILASVLFQTEGASVSLTYNYGNNGKDLLKAGVTLGAEIAGTYIATKIGLSLMASSMGLSIAALPVLPAVAISALAAVGIGLFLNTQVGKWVTDSIAEHLIQPLIDNLKPKLQSFFSMFDSNPLEYELVPNPTLSSKDYQSLIELLLNKNSNALDIDTLLHTFPNYLAYPTHSYSTKDSTNSSLSLSTPKDALPIHIKAQCFNHKKEALSNREIYVYSPNFYSFVDRAKSDENGFIEFHNAYVSSKMTNSDLYFVLNRYGLDEEQKDFHIKISPSKTIQPKDKQVGELLEQRLSFEKNIPKAITLNDNIKPNIKVNAIEYIPQEYNHNSFNSPLEHHLIESITLQAHYVLKDSHKKNIQGDEQSLLKESIQRYKHKTKWGYIVFDRDEEIEQTLKQVNKTQPLVYSKRFKELENIKGEIVNIPFKEEWENKQIRFFAYLWRANRDVGIDVHYQATIPDNVIRIETLDESDEFIEIILPEEQEENNTNDIEQENDWLDTAKDLALDLGLAVISRGRYKPKNRTNKVNKGATNFNRSLTREEVLEVVDKLPTAKELGITRSKRVHFVRNTKELDELVNKFTKNAKYIGEHKQTIKVKKTGQKEEVNVLEYFLDDGTPIGIRSNSQTGGKAIDINKKEKIIHNLETIRK